MFAKQHRTISEAFRNIPGTSNAASLELARAFCDADQTLEHKGIVRLTTSFPYQSRGYSADAAAVKLRPTPPVAPPLVTSGLIELTNAPRELSDRSGENGYALYVKQGNVRFDGETWALKWARVVTTGTTTDSRPLQVEAITSDISSTYYYADCWECTDMKGRKRFANEKENRPDTNVRVFIANSEDIPQKNSVIPYLRDLNGLAVCMALRGGAVNITGSGTQISLTDAGDGMCNLNASGVFPATYATIDTAQAFTTDAPITAGDACWAWPLHLPITTGGGRMTALQWRAGVTFTANTVGFLTVGSDTRPLVVFELNLRRLKGVLDGALAFNGSATMSIYDADGDTGENMTVYDEYLTAGSLSAGTEVGATYYGQYDKWFVTEANC